MALQEEQKKEEENKLEYERNKKQLARFGRQLNHLQKQKERDTPKINKILIQSIETHRATVSYTHLTLPTISSV